MTPDTYLNALISIRINYRGQISRHEVLYRELLPTTLPEKLRQLLNILSTSEIRIERYSDSQRAFILLDTKNSASYKNLYRAAVAKLRLHLRVTRINPDKLTSNTFAIEKELNSSSIVQCSAKSYQKILPSSNTSIPPAVCKLYEQKASDSKNNLEDYKEERTTNDISNFQSATKTATTNLNGTIILQKSSTITLSNDLPNTESQITSEVSSPPPPTLRNKSCNVKSCPQDYSKFYHEPSTQRKESVSSATTSCPLDLSVFCNYCNSIITEEHYHCSTCDDGDYDLCYRCLDDGILCKGEGHWLIKRLIKDGKAVNSTTEIIAPKFRIQPLKIKNSSKTSIPAPTRTCNCCIQVFTENEFVTCTTCLDYDLCISCHIDMKHGHNPKHAFETVGKNKRLNTLARNLLAPGRHVKHNASCDGCKKTIYGVRNKCFECPDWDYCSSCILTASTTHPNHRFIPIYETSDIGFACDPSKDENIRHHGVFCDGPLCKNNTSYISGIRYKCAICDVDFCANCEASPRNTHNPTHPLIKLRTPARHVSITAQGDVENRQRIPIKDDKEAQTILKPIENPSSQQINAATQVHTIFDSKPLETFKLCRTELETNQTKIEVTNTKANKASAHPPHETLVAHFIHDVIVDGTIMLPNSVFVQSWYLRNPCENPWPKGCYIKFVGGTKMSVGDFTPEESLHGPVSTRDSMILDFEVAKGQTIWFTISMKSPSYDGNYISHWRLSTPDQRIFGPKLWCDITVKTPEHPNVSKSQTIQPECVEMIFPKLENEKLSKQICSQTTSQTDAYEDDFDLITEEKIENHESIELFVTDDEYDILNASDEEYTTQL